MRQVHLGRFLRSLQRLADEFGIAVVVTNQVWGLALPVRCCLMSCWSVVSGHSRPRDEQTPLQSSSQSSCLPFHEG